MKPPTIPSKLLFKLKIIFSIGDIIKKNIKIKNAIFVNDGVTSFIISLLLLYLVLVFATANCNELIGGEKLNKK